MSLPIFRHFIYSFYSLTIILHILFVLSSKFNWKPVFKSQINHTFLLTTPNRTARDLFTAGLYLACNHLVV